ncbi:MAG: DUF106 domain-containing protein [Candidatus Aenigmatarchaeota archaeon]|nr:MAG: DUF106 domain-containing protein [Candidatus Aenigmarchaeota archaeon]
MMELSPFLTITLLSIGLSVIITVIYRVLTKPEEIRKMKDDMRFYKNKMNEAKKAGDRAKMNEYANEMLKASQRQFRSSMKPMMVTILIFFLLLGWLNTNFGGVRADFSGENEPVFSYAGEEHSMMYESNDEGFVTGVDFNDDGTFSEDERFANDEVFRYSGALWKPVTQMEGFFLFAEPKEEAVRFEMFIAEMPFELPLIGNYLSWFWWYFFISLPATFILRKLMGVV